ARIRRLFSRLSCNTYTFGIDENNDYRAVNTSLSENGCPSYDVQYKGNIIAHIQLQVIGEINLLDSLAAFAAAHLSGLDAKTIAEALNRFAGVHRRFELTGIVDGVKLYHDYGHNPVEMRTAVASAMMQKAGHVFAVMQPHTYSRVKTLFDDYLECTKAADTTLVTEIFAAREKDPGDIRSEMLVEGMQKHGVNAVLTPSFDDAEAYLRTHWQPGDLMITMGCGNINLLNEQIQKHGDSQKN
ncbi:MAG: UDP-N-acetylmuramate--L-alanine ligase, partial [Clostridia bacterium]|nr:UDP-N-acetylmuramate--L-alanine ligase [Clostridia bacterium]